MNKKELQIYTNILRTKFIKKISTEWVMKWQPNHGNSIYDFELLTNKNLFLENLVEDIKQVYLQDNLQGQVNDFVISKDSIRRVLINENANEWQLKTRNNLSKYVGYQNWEDFIANVNLNDQFRISNINSWSFLPKVEKKYVYISLVAIILPVVWVLIIINNNNSSIEFLKQNWSNSYPSSVVLKVNLRQNQYPNYKIKIDNENFQTVSSDILLKNPLVHLNFYTPGMKIISLQKNKKNYQELKYLVGTNNNWYGAYSFKENQQRTEIEKNSEFKWYGSLQNGNGFYLSTPNDWKEQKQHFQSKGILYLPIENKKQIEIFSKVAFLKAAPFDINLNEIDLNFKVKKDTVEMDNCVSFMTQLYDEDLNKIELRFGGNCNLSSHLRVKKRQKLNENVLNSETNSDFEINSLNQIIEDHHWHTCQIRMNKTSIKIVVDGAVHFEKNINEDFLKLREIWFVFNGNGAIDDVRLENNISKRLIFSNDFSN